MHHDWVAMLQSKIDGKDKETIQLSTTLTQDITWETLTLLHANIKGADQPAHPRSLISAFDIRYVSCSMQIFNIFVSRCN